MTKLNCCNHGDAYGWLRLRICYFGDRVCYFGELICYFGDRINQAQAWQVLGFYRRGLTILTQLQQQLQSQPNSVTKAVELRSFGDALQLAGDLKQSRQILQQSLEIAQKLDSPQDVSAALFSLGNTAQVQQDFKGAIEFYQQAAAIAPNPITKVQAEINQLLYYMTVSNIW